MLRLKRTIVNKSRCLHASYQLPGFKAVRPQLAINILRSHMWTMIIFIVLKMLANCNKIAQKIAVHATKVLSSLIFKFLYAF